MSEERKGDIEYTEETGKERRKKREGFVRERRETEEEKRRPRHGLGMGSTGWSTAAAAGFQEELGIDLLSNWSARSGRLHWSSG